MALYTLTYQIMRFRSSIGDADVVVEMNISGMMKRFEILIGSLGKLKANCMDPLISYQKDICQRK